MLFPSGAWSRRRQSRGTHNQIPGSIPLGADLNKGEDGEGGEGVQLWVVEATRRVGRVVRATPGRCSFLEIFLLFYMSS